MEQASIKRAEEISQGLFPHQIEGIAFLLGRRRALLADDMGLGKTRQSVLAMVEAEDEGPYLVICPASIKRNWEREIKIVLPNAEPKVVGPNPLPIRDHNDWVIINYELLGKNLETLLEYDWRGVVFDEAHYLKESPESTKPKRCKTGSNHRKQSCCPCIDWNSHDEPSP